VAVFAWHQVRNLNWSQVLIGVNPLADGYNVGDWRRMTFVLPCLPQSKIVAAFNPARV
jgi:hypothetical protein